MPDEVKPAAAEPEGEAAVTPQDPAAGAPAPAVETQVAAEVVYALALPKDSPLDPKATERFEAFAKAHGLSPEAAQAAIERTHEEVHEAWKVLEAAIKPGGVKYEAQVTAWAQDALNAHDLGNGDPTRLAAVVTEAQLELAKAPPAIREFLAQSGYGSHPDAIRWFRSLAARTKEKPLVIGDGGAAPPKPKSYAERMYGEPAAT